MFAMKRRTEGVLAPPPEQRMTDAMAELEQAQQALAAAPWDAHLRERFRLAHNAVADISAALDTSSVA